MSVNDILKQSQNLSAYDKLKLVDMILESLDLPTSSVQDEIKEEVEDRINAFEEGKLKSKSMEEVFKKYEN